MSKVVDLYDEDAMFEEMQETLVIEKGEKVNLDSTKRGKYVKEEEGDEDEGEEGEEGEPRKKKKTKRLSAK
jgi:hypothetical protein